MSGDGTDQPARLRSIPQWRRFWIARTISLSGSAVSTVVLPILVFRLTGSASLTALLTTVEALPYLALGLFAGAIADRVDRRRLMLWAELVDGVLMLSIPVAYWLGHLTAAQVLVVALLAASVFVWFDAASFGAVPSLVGRELVVEANASLSSTSSVILIAGPAVGGVLATTIGPASAVTIDAASFLLGGLILLSLELPPVAAAAAAVRGRTRREIREGLAFIRRHRLVRTLTLLGTGNSLTGGAVIGLLVVYAVRQLHLATGDVRVGALYASTGVGALAASLAVGWASRRYPLGRLTLAGLGANCFLMVGLAVSTGFWVALPVLALWQATNTLVIINGIAIRQLVTPDHLQSRVNTTARMIAWGGQPLGAALGGVLADHLSMTATLLVMTTGVAVSAVLGCFSTLRSPLTRAQLMAEATP